MVREDVPFFVHFMFYTLQSLVESSRLIIASADRPEVIPRLLISSLKNRNFFLWSKSTPKVMEKS